MCISPRLLIFLYVEDVIFGRDRCLFGVLFSLNIQHVDTPLFVALFSSSGRIYVGVSIAFPYTSLVELLSTFFLSFFFIFFLLLGC